jgi:hypothetical protein
MRLKDKREVVLTQREIGFLLGAIDHATLSEESYLHGFDLMKETGQKMSASDKNDCRRVRNAINRWARIRVKLKTTLKARRRK